MTIAADLLEKALLAAAASYARGELAYLALTSKPELAIRDRLAWVLHHQLTNHVIAREWAAPGSKRARTDLAVLDTEGRRPLVLMEAKAAYTFDFVSPEQQSGVNCRARVERDLAKARIAARDERVAVYGLVLLTHPVEVPADFPRVIKYLPEIRRSLRYRTSGELQRLASDTADAHFAGFGPSRSGSLDGGVAFGVRTLVEYRLIGPVHG
ncbi:hypothetical protein ACFU9F_34995 [Streptomyces zhihengii]|uniref:hypothetical protein n=1 Tax=Streptomyces zhihengii TaxID=1818004 RepID=UPI00367C89B0